MAAGFTNWHACFSSCLTSFYYPLRQILLWNFENEHQQCIMSYKLKWVRGTPNPMESCLCKLSSMNSSFAFNRLWMFHNELQVCLILMSYTFSVMFAYIFHRSTVPGTELHSGFGPDVYVSVVSLADGKLIVWLLYNVSSRHCFHHKANRLSYCLCWHIIQWLFVASLQLLWANTKATVCWEDGPLSTYCKHQV